MGLKHRSYLPWGLNNSRQSFQRQNAEICNDILLPNPYIHFIHENFPVSFNKKETNEPTRVAIVTVKNYTDWKGEEL
jgi:hypothetical protein